MDDRQLLEMAAKAAGIEVVRSRLDDPLNLDMLVENSARNSHQRSGPWNPLTDDGDALRLAVKLQLDIEHLNDAVFAQDPSSSGCPSWSTREPVEGDRYAATRRCIVRAAASLAKEQS